MLLEYFEIKKYHQFENFEINFKERVTAIYGPNGIGKTKLLEQIFHTRNMDDHIDTLLLNGELQTQTKKYTHQLCEAWQLSSYRVHNSEFNAIKHIMRYIRDLYMVQEAHQPYPWYLLIIDSLLKTILPIKEFGVNKKTQEFYVIYKNSPDGQQVPLHLLSHGELKIVNIILGVLGFALVSTEKNKQSFAECELLFLIDDMETYLHLHEQRKIPELLLTTFPKSQFIFTTHSPCVAEITDEMIGMKMNDSHRVICNYSEK